ncbi:unnamed protein product, partial [Prorocentrum cordatum]
MAASCAICKQALEDGEELVRLGCLRGPCHKECVNAHMQVHGLDFANFPCPECRTTERQLQSMEAARLQRQQVVSSSGSSAAAGRRRAAVFRIPLAQGGERRITGENRRSRSPPPRVVADSPIMQPESPGGAIVPAASPIGRAVVPAASPIGRGLSQSISPSQSQPSRPQGPAITDADFGFTLTDNTAAGGDGAPVPDPSLAAIRALDAVPNAAAFRTALHPTGLFNGLQDERGTRETAKQWLGEMLADPRDHKEVGMDPSFSIRLLLPRPFRAAVVAVASREGWQPEALMQGIMSNAGWLERHATVLKETADETHSRKPTIAIFCAAMPPTRKTSLARFVSVSLLGDTDEGRQLQACTCGDATLRGLLNCISTHERSGLVNDEITTAYDTTFSQGSRGCHYAGKPTMLKFVNGERSITMTGHGAVNLGTYGFLHQVWGEIPAVEEVLQRDSIGFRKRFNTIWFGEAAGHPTQNTEQSTILLTALMSWMCQNALPQQEVHCFDNFSLSMYRAFMSGISNFIDENPGLDQLIREKLQFADTDILRPTVLHMFAFICLPRLVSYRTQPSGKAGGHAHVSLVWSLPGGNAGLLAPVSRQLPRGDAADLRVEPFASSARASHRWRSEAVAHEAAEARVAPVAHEAALSEGELSRASGSAAAFERLAAQRIAQLPKVHLALLLPSLGLSGNGSFAYSGSREEAPMALAFAASAATAFIPGGVLPSAAPALRAGAGASAPEQGRAGAGAGWAAAAWGAPPARHHGEQDGGEGHATRPRRGLRGLRHRPPGQRPVRAGPRGRRGRLGPVRVRPRGLQQVHRVRAVVPRGGTQARPHLHAGLARPGGPRLRADSRRALLFRGGPLRSRRARQAQRQRWRE